MTEMPAQALRRMNSMAEAIRRSDCRRCCEDCRWTLLRTP